VLFVATAVSIYSVGGPLMAVALLSILVAHEMGHYLACRYYGVDATLPFFIPLPVVGLVGTLGAFIRIRSPFPHRRALFDIGIAGPLAGFVVCLPVLVFGIAQAQYLPIDQMDKNMYLSLGDPLLFDWAVTFLRGEAPPGTTLVLGNVGLAAWFGLFMTALNLMPIGQLDGGHVMYALLGPRAAVASRVAFGICVALVYFGPNWLVWSILLLVLGRRHPHTMNDSATVGDGRIVVGLIGLLVFIVSFVPNPIVGFWPKLFEAFR
jgi:membrane-associated protease RseP (regulator of RpoE activity)